MSDVLQLELPRLLPDVPDAEDPCIRRLSESLRGRPGVKRTHVTERARGKSATLCVHYEPDKADANRLRKVARATGRRLTEHIGHTTGKAWPIENAQRAQKVAGKLRQIDGVVEAKVTPGGRIRVEHDRKRIAEKEIRGALALMGVTIGP